MYIQPAMICSRRACFLGGICTVYADSAQHLLGGKLGSADDLQYRYICPTAWVQFLRKRVFTRAGQGGGRTGGGGREIEGRRLFLPK